MVFITGTPENKGRVASHPRKGTPSMPSSSSSKSPRPSTEPESSTTKPERVLDLVPAQPLTSAWEDYITLSSNEDEHHTLTTALQVPLGAVIRQTTDSSNTEPFSIVLPPYTPLDLSPNVNIGNFAAGGQCLVHVAPSDDTGGSSECFCVFLFEVGHLLDRSVVSESHTD